MLLSPDERVREAVLLEEKVFIDTKRVESKYDKKKICNNRIFVNNHLGQNSVFQLCPMSIYT